MNKTFIKLAKITAQKSADPNTQVGCYLVSPDNKVLGFGYNRMPLRSNVLFPWGKSDDIVKSKYPYVIHAEMSAIVNCKTKPDVFDAYVTLFPCSNCAKLLIEFGVRNIYYISDKYADLADTIASKKLLDGCGVRYFEVEEC